MLKSKLMVVFIAFALVITVGGVYAAWSYTTSDAADVTTPAAFNPSITIDQAETIGAPGTISVNDANKLAYKVDNAGDYRTTLTDSGNIVISYEPSVGSPYTKMNVKVTFTLTSAQYESTDILFLSSPQAQNGVLVLERELVGTGEDAWTITNADITLAMNEFVLDTHADWEAFQVQLAQCQLTVNIVATETPAN